MNKMRVMLVDDEAYVRVILRELVKSIPGEVVIELENGLEVLKQYEELQPDLVLLDINMPFKTGDEVVTELKQSFPDACIVIMTGIADSELIGQCIDSGAAGYIRKDHTLAEMREQLSVILSND